jgi:sugar lactone lactonase YvrE
MPAIETLVDGLDHPEGVCWDPRAEVLWAGGEAGQVYRVNSAFARRDLDRLACANLGRRHLSLVETGLRGSPLLYPTHWVADV